MNMNQTIGRIGAALVTATVLLFAVCMVIPFDFGSYTVCMFLAVGYVMMCAAYSAECEASRSAAGKAGLAFACVYATLILQVYFAQVTTVHPGGLSEQASMILDFSRGGLIFNYDLLGYGMMALSTLLIGLSIEPKLTEEKWLKGLMIAHGAFFPVCLIMPMTGVFASMNNGEMNFTGVVALEFWCAYFLPIGILSLRRFGRRS